MSSATDHVLAERARIQQEVEGRTLLDALATTAERYGDQLAYSDRHGVTEGWRTITWGETRERVLDVAAGLVDLGPEAGQTVAIMTSNRNEHFLADMGTTHAAGVPMSIYNTLSPAQVAFVASQSTPTVAIVETADHLARWEEARAAGHVTTVVTINGDGGDLSWDELIERGRARRQANPDEIEELEEEDVERSPVKEWLVMIGQLAVGVLGGAALWLGFNFLWRAIPAAALVLALGVTVGLVLLVRKIRKADDLQTTLLAVLVGLIVTVSPAAMLLVKS